MGPMQLAGFDAAHRLIGRIVFLKSNNSRTGYRSLPATGKPANLQIADKVPHSNVQCVSNNLECSQCHALPARLNPVQMHSV
jgi:hypothetical protein